MAPVARLFDAHLAAWRDPNLSVDDHAFARAYSIFDYDQIPLPLAEGDRLEITGPFGVFTLREGDNDLVFVGGGAGMAPILSLLRSMAERGLQRKATFFYGARTRKDLCFDVCSSDLRCSSRSRNALAKSDDPSSE